MDKTTKTIKLAKEIAPIISSREIVDFLERIVLKSNNKSYDLDFTNIEFVSRSAAHSLLVMREDLSHKLLKSKKIEFINMNSEVREMFRIVASNRAVPKDKPNFKAERSDIESLV